MGGTQGFILLKPLCAANARRIWLSLKSGVQRHRFAPGNRLSFVPGRYFWPPVLPASTRRLNQPMARPWVSWGLMWVQHVWHLVMDPNTSWPHLMFFHVHAHPAHAGAGHLKVGTVPVQSSIKQEPFKIKALPEKFPPFCWKKDVPMALTCCHLAAWGQQRDSPEMEVKPAFPWGTSPEGSKTEICDLPPNNESPDSVDFLFLSWWDQSRT